MAWDLGIGLKLFDYALKYRKQIGRGWDLLFRTEPIKLNLEPPPRHPPKVYRCHTSNVTVLIALDRNRILFLNTGTSGWNDREVTFEVDVDSPEIDAVFHSLERGDRVIIARWYKVALCNEITKKRNYSVSGRNRWEFALRIYVNDFSDAADTGASHAQRVLRARRLLFDEKGEDLGVPENFPEKDVLDYLNKVAKEWIIAGHNDIKGSPLLELFEKFGRKPRDFYPVRVDKTRSGSFGAGIVTNIEHLELELPEEGHELQINLVATRDGQDVILNGICNLKPEVAAVAAV